MSRIHYLSPVISLLILLTFPTSSHAQTGLRCDYEASVSANLGSGDFAPYYIGANRGGRVTQRTGLATEAVVKASTDTARRFSIMVGLDAIGSWTSSVSYDRYSEATDCWTSVARHPARGWVQQLFVGAKYRSIDLSIGMKDYQSRLLNNRLSSGDVTRSANARSLPEISVGITRFRKIPFTKGWLEAEGLLSYGKFTDNDWWRSHFNYYTYHISQNQWLVYRRLYLRSDASRRFSITLGLQAATQFGGRTEHYWNGHITTVQERPTRIKDFVKVLIPVSRGNEDFLIGNTLGSIDIMARYRFKSGNEIKLYLQNPWEDGSGLGKLNGFDGLWGVEFNFSRRGIISGCVFEYLDMTNQSGPIHWAPDYIPGTDIKDEATGADNYYNNYYYNSYANYGMLMGNPLVVSPIYNRDGFPAVLYNRMRAFHLGVEGQPLPRFNYRVLASFRKSWGNGYIPLLSPVHAVSAMVETTYQAKRINGLAVTVQLGIDHGKLPCNSFGGLIGVSYSGKFTAHN